MMPITREIPRHNLPKDSAFTANDKQLKGVAGAIAVLHTHNRRLDYHPHVYLVVPAGAINPKDKGWRSRVKRGFLFSHKALGKVFRAKLLSQLASDKLTVPTHTAKTWNVGCQSVGRGDKAIVYLGRYLYKGVVREKDIVGVQGKEITYRLCKAQHDEGKKTLAWS